MLHSGHNDIEGVPVEVVRKRIRRINIRVAAGGIGVSIGSEVMLSAFAKEKQPCHTPAPEKQDDRKTGNSLHYRQCGCDKT